MSEKMIVATSTIRQNLKKDIKLYFGHLTQIDDVCLHRLTYCFH
ncbi:hypothetical protein MTBPR1_120010 [Candidatus Terasakiella magnetica]|uniref:Uncharacterized protein n=1 Tax=Candidatus Terasakiella magnetica TaxID=1867952 RepID=A0A1C3RER7_9PROT|nr:hypothetical protein MTBPR1_120010 [Candidatus Terasakiella magnetica]